MSVPGYYDYVTPASFLLAQQGAQNALTTAQQNYQNLQDVPWAFGDLNVPPAFDYPVQWNATQVPNWQAAANNYVSEIDRYVFPQGIDPQPGSAIRAATGGAGADYYDRVALPGGYVAPGDWQGSVGVFSGGQGGYAWSNEEPFAQEWGDNARQIGYSAGGMTRVTPGYQSVIGALNDGDRWADLADSAYSALQTSADTERGNAVTEGRARLASRGMLGSSLANALLGKISGMDVGEDIGGGVDQALDFYAGLRNTDFAELGTMLGSDQQTAMASALPTRTASDYASMAGSREATNASQAADYASNLSLAGIFNEVLRRIQLAQAGDSTVSAGGGGLTAYSGDLASPSQINQRLPYDQTVASQFSNAGGGGRGYSGTGG